MWRIASVPKMSRKIKESFAVADMVAVLVRKIEA
jgi:hypothetical protein